MICASLRLAAAFCATRILYHIRFDLSRGFWKVFKKFFKALFEPFPLLLERSARLLYHISFRLSRGFWKVFQKFSWFLSGSLLQQGFRKATRLLYHISFHLSRGFSKVFQLFSIFFFGACPFAVPPFRRRSRSMLAYYSTSSPNCQGVFTNFFHFGLIGTLS